MFQPAGEIVQTAAHILRKPQVGGAHGNMNFAAAFDEPQIDAGIVGCLPNIYGNGVA